MLLVSCSVGIDKKNFAELVSSSVGGYLGYQLSDADIFSTAIGSSVGLLVGGYIGDYLNKNDYYYYKTSLLNTLDKNEVEASGYWKNHKTGNEGVIFVKHYYGNPECRLIEHKYIVKNTIKNKTKNSFDTACRKNNGSWSVIR